MKDNADIKIDDVQKQIWNLIDRQFAEETSQEQLYVTGAVLLQTAIELYSVILEDDDIQRLFDSATKSIPDLRQRMQDRLGPRVIH